MKETIKSGKNKSTDKITESASAYARRKNRRMDCIKQ